MTADSTDRQFWGKTTAYTVAIQLYWLVFTAICLNLWLFFFLVPYRLLLVYAHGVSVSVAVSRISP